MVRMISYCLYHLLHNLTVVGGDPGIVKFENLNKMFAFA